MKFLKLKIPPDLVFLVFGAAIWAASNFFPVMNLYGSGWLSGFVGVLGGMVVFAAIYQFKTEKTTVNPLKPHSASSIVSSGIYRFTRNPMYLGMLLLLTAFAIKYLNILSPLFLIGFVLYMNRFQIIPEEKALTEKFEGDYLEYKKSVRRWI